LLLRSPYRTRWEAQADKIKSGEVNQAAVCQVLARYLWDAGLESETRTDLPRILKDSVSRAFRHGSLSPKLLRTFITAFDFAAEDAEYTMGLYRGEKSPSVLVGNLPPLILAGVQQKPRYRTVSLHDFYYLGPDGQPFRHRAVHDIQALVDGITFYQYSFDTNEATVDRISGGTPGQQYVSAENMWSVDISLPRVLNVGDEHTLEFVNTFHYKTPPEPCFRRITHKRVENVAIRVQFHADKLPQLAWWTEWEDYREPNDIVIHRELAALDAEHAVYRRLDAVDNAAVGFTWEF
jgi:hypothetical protein